MWDGGRTLNCQSLIIQPLLSNPDFPFIGRRRGRFPALARARRRSQNRTRNAAAASR
jgi:hypothetical protein